MAKSAKERMAEYRRRKRENPEEFEQYKAAERERYRKRKERGEIQLANELSERDLRVCRRRWKKTKRAYREKQKMLNNLISVTPPMSPERDGEEIILVPPPSQNRSASMTKSHKRRQNKERSACYRANKKLKIKLKTQEKLKEKYKKRFNRLKIKFTKKQKSKAVEQMSQKSYNLYQAMIMNIRRWYRRSKSMQDRKMIGDIICGKRTLKKYGLGAFCHTVTGISRRHLNARGHVKRTAGVRKLNMREKVREFMVRDDNSRLKADKQATITRKGIKKQIRLMTDDLKTLHKKYQLEGNKMSYSLFCKLRPFWILKPSEKDRNTCLCKIHENLTFKVNAGYTANMITSKDPIVLMKQIVCDTEKKECMYRECEDCEGKTLNTDYVNVAGDQLTWNVWRNKRLEREREGKSKVITMTVKEKVQGTKQTLAEELNQDLQRACRHFFNIRHQYQALRTLKEKMSHEEALMHIDFSENYSTKYESEIQSMHFGPSRRQISLHTGVAYIGDQVHPFCTVSDCLKHGPAAIWAHLEPIIKYIKTIKQLTGIHFLSDGPTTQYRNKMSFYLWNKRVFDLGFRHSSWNFLEASHGKGAADGIGAAIKRAADHQVNVKGRDIACAKDLVECVQQSSSVKMFLVDETSIEEVEESLPSSLKPIPSTMKLHQLYTSKHGEVACRVLSCFCAHPSMCDCFTPLSHQFERLAMTAVEDRAITEVEDRAITMVEDSAITAVEDSAITDSETLAADNILTVPPELDETLISQYCVVEYDKLPYPGLILDVDDDSAEVKVMHRIGINRFFWPLHDDVLWYKREHFITILRDEPEHVTGRHMQLKKDVWQEIVKKMDL